MIDSHAATTEMLLALAAEEFEKIVISQLNRQRRDPLVYAALMSPKVVVHTKEALDILRARSQNSMQAKRSDMNDFQADCAAEGPDGKLKWLKGRGEYMDSLRRTGHFLKLIEIMQIEAKRGVREAKTALHEARLTERAARRAASPHTVKSHRVLWTLVGALIDHEDKQLGNCTAEDEKLWDLLDTLTCIWDEETMSLREAYERGWGEK